MSVLPGDGARRYDQEIATRWLSNLARGMENHGQSVFLVEQLQPSWLASKWDQVAYAFASRILSGAIFGIICATLLSAVTQSVAYAFEPFTFGLLYGMVMGGYDAIRLVMRKPNEESSVKEGSDDQPAKVRWGSLLAHWVMYFMGVGSIFMAYWMVNDLRRIEPIVLFIMGGVLTGLFFLTYRFFFVDDTLGLFREPIMRAAKRMIVCLFASGVGLFAWSRFFEATYLSPRAVLAIVISGSVFAMIWTRVCKSNIVNEIDCVERLHWDWRRGLSAWLAAFFLVVIVVLYLMVRLRLPVLDLGVSVAEVGILIACVTWVFAAVYGLRPELADFKATPNEGIWLSGRNAIYGGIFSAVSVVPTFLWIMVFSNEVSEAMFADQSSSASFLPRLFFLFGLPLVLGLLMIGFAWFGGLCLVLHFTLRAILTVRGVAPYRYVEFLDYAADELGLLRRNGSGYLFLHRMLQEHFAKRPPTSEEVASA